jgi:glyoxylase-like metal-dependent hydrolase (beta-lactamase superfamily II)
LLADEVVDGNRTITLGDTTLELMYVGLNHSDSSLVMRLPRQRLLFAVDFIPVGSVPARGMIDSYPLEWEDSLTRVLAEIRGLARLRAGTAIRPTAVLRPLGRGT